MTPCVTTLNVRRAGLLLAFVASSCSEEGLPSPASMGDDPGRVSTRTADGDASDRAMLLDAAAAAGLADRSTVRRAVARAAVRSLLRAEVEAKTSVSEVAARARYEAQRGRFVGKERRNVTHLLVPVDGAAPELTRRGAREAAERALQSALSGQAAKVFEAWTEQPPAPGARVEPLGAFDRDAPFVAPFLEACFAMDEAGVLRHIVETEFGFHVIWLRDIQPPLVLSFEDVREQITSELLVSRRAERLAGLIAQSRKRARPVLYDDTTLGQGGASRPGM